MQPTNTYAPRDNNVASEDFEGEFVVLDLESGKYFSLSGGSALVWRGLIAGHSVESLTTRFPLADPRRDGVAGLVAALIAHNLIVPATHNVVPDEATAEELSSAAGPFEVEMFDDLADLLVADPIHDVDENAGWPHRPTSGDT